MADIPPFLHALELGADADERAIRRAYARRLKQIDAEADPTAFQALRETFENALKWAAWQARLAAGGQGEASTPMPAAQPAAAPVAPASDASAAPPAAPDPSPAAPPVVQDNPGELVFANFVARFARGAREETDVARQIADALADVRLVNLDARAFFEWRVAGMIVSGWRPGHEFLFKPACDAFGWEEDRRRLAAFGQVGAIMDAAIRERLIFFGQPASAFESQRKLIWRLRSEKPTSVSDLAAEIPMLSMLLQRYPHWMRTMTRQEIVQHWIDTWNALPPEQRKAAAPSPAARAGATQPYKAAKKQSFGAGAAIWLVLAVIGGFSRLASLGNGGDHRYTSLPPTPGYQAPASRPPAWANLPNAAAPSAAFTPTPLYGDGTVPLDSTNYFPTPEANRDETRKAAAAKARAEANAKALRDADAKTLRDAAARVRQSLEQQPPPRKLPTTRDDYRLGTPDPTSVPIGGYASQRARAPSSSDFQLTTKPDEGTHQ